MNLFLVRWSLSLNLTQSLEPDNFLTSFSSSLLQMELSPSVQPFKILPWHQIQVGILLHLGQFNYIMYVYQNKMYYSLMMWIVLYSTL